MTIVELLAEVGADNLTYQKLHDCVIGVTQVKRGVDITFGTTACGVDNFILEPTHLAFVVWVPAEHARRVQAKIDAESSRPKHCCGLSGFNPTLGDTCPACEAGRAGNSLIA